MNRHVQLKPSLDDMVHVPGGVSILGSNAHYPEEEPAHEVRVDPFRIDCHALTNRHHERAPHHCRRYRPAARMAQPVDASTCRMGLRCIVLGSRETSP